jgi:1A family penicillin-binding protein
MTSKDLDPYVRAGTTFVRWDGRPASRRPPLGEAFALRVLAILTLAVVMLGSMALAVAAGVDRIQTSVAHYTDISVPPIPVGPQTTFVYDGNGKLVTTLHAAVNRTIVPLSKISQDMQNAVVSVEDKDFYRHGALDAVSIFRAAYENALSGRITQGGSTITQQLVKNLFTTGERTLTRKIHEAVLAVKLERQYSKKEILNKYLNTVYFGHGAYGAEAAALTYYGVHARELGPLWSATLAAMVAAPSRFDPSHKSALRDRRDMVLEKMGEQGYVTPATGAALQAKPLRFPGLSHPKPTPYPYFMQYVTQSLLQRQGYDKTFEGGLRVTTTLDPAMQQEAEAAVATHLPLPTDPSAALVAIDPATGEIKALVGGKDFNKVKFNLATQAHRQTGSAAKVFTLAAAMEQRISLSSTWNGPPNLVIDDPRCFDPIKQQPWDVSNAGDESAGTMSLKEATAHSVNTIFAQLVVDVGPDRVVDVAHRLGIRSKLQDVCSITLGSQAVTPLEMTSAYATVAAQGVHHPPHAISAIEDAHGTNLSTANYKGDRAISANDANMVTYALQGVVDHGTGTAANIGRPVAGKTGTGQEYRDAWFCGYTPQLATCVWVGYKAGEIPLVNVEGFPAVFGGTIPALIWHDFMSQAMSGYPVQDFVAPDFTGYDKVPQHAFVPPPPTPSPSPTPSPTPSGPPGQRWCHLHPHRCHH